MGQKKNLFGPEQIVEQRPAPRQDASRPPQDSPRRLDLWPFLLFIALLTLITLLIWIGQAGR